MDIACENILCVVQDLFRVVREDDFYFRAAVFDQVAVVLYIIYACELVLVLSEQFPVLGKIQHVAVRIDSCFVHLIHGDEGVTDFIARITQHQDDLLRALCDAAQADGEPVS